MRKVCADKRRERSPLIVVQPRKLYLKRGEVNRAIGKDSQRQSALRCANAQRVHGAKSVAILSANQRAAECSRGLNKGKCWRRVGLLCGCEDYKKKNDESFV